jgi:hypothetical protein
MKSYGTRVRRIVTVGFTVALLLAAHAAWPPGVRAWLVPDFGGQPWTPPIPAPHSSYCDTAVSHRESLALLPPSQLHLTVSINTARLHPSLALLYYRIDGGSTQVSSTTASGSTATLTVFGSQLPANSVIEYAFEVRGVFVEPQCVQYSAGISPSLNSFFTYVTNSPVASKIEVFRAHQHAATTLTAQPGFGAGTPPSQVCAAFFTAPTPCTLYPAVNQTPAPMSGGSAQPAVLSVAAGAGDVSCTVTNTGFYFDKPTGVDRPNGLDLNAVGGYSRTDLSSSGKTVSHSSFTGQAAWGGSTKVIGYSRTGFRGAINGDGLPAGTTINLAASVPWTVSGQSSAKATSATPALTSVQSFVDAPTLTPGWEDMTTQSQLEYPVTWTGLSGTAASSVSNPDLRDVPQPTISSAAALPLTVFTGDTYFWYLKAMAQNRVVAQELTAGEAQTDLAITTPSVTLVIETAGYHWSSCPG